MHYASDLITPVSFNLHISSVVTTEYVCGTLNYMQLIVTYDLYCARRLNMLYIATFHQKNIMLVQNCDKNYSRASPRDSLSMVQVILLKVCLRV